MADNKKHSPLLGEAIEGAATGGIVALVLTILRLLNGDKGGGGAETPELILARESAAERKGARDEQRIEALNQKLAEINARPWIPTPLKWVILILLAILLWVTNHGVWAVIIALGAIIAAILQFLLAHRANQNGGNP
jgi:hypothetical protein